MNLCEISPLSICRLSGSDTHLSSLVSDVLDEAKLRRHAPTLGPDVVESLRLALIEVLHTVIETTGKPSDSDNAAVELWLEERLLIICVKFLGSPLPHWLTMNWDRAQEPERLAPSGDAGWGWLLVREAVDTVSYMRRGPQQHLYLERRI